MHENTVQHANLRTRGTLSRTVFLEFNPEIGDAVQYPV